MVRSFAFFGDSAVCGVLADNLQAAGFELADSVEQADAVFTYCLSQDQLEDAYWGTKGVLHMMKQGGVMVDLSPSTPGFAKENYAMARVSEVQALDAPITVADITSEHAFSDSSNLVMLVGGESDVVETMMPMLTAIAQTVRPMGVPGNGQLAKVSQTIQLAAQLVAVVESHAICRANGEHALESVQAAVEDGLASPKVEALCRCIEGRDFHGSYTTQVLLSELQAVMNASEDTDVVLPQAEACLRLVELFLVVGGTDMNATALGLVYADQDECKRYHLDWSRAENLYEQDHDDDEDEDLYEQPAAPIDENLDDGYQVTYHDGYRTLSSN
jgi:3-hydroxyisobutyrate dehydrogenase